MRTEEALHRIQADIEKQLKAKVVPSARDSQKTDIKLFVNRGGVQIKIEANPVMRGTLHDPDRRSLRKNVIDEFEVEIEMQISSLPDLYGGKIAAALDRQHPRDLFDIKLLFENEGITEDIKNGFVIYLLGHKRPPHEILNPSLRDQKSTFSSEFEGMSNIPFSYEDFEKTRGNLIESIKKKLSKADRQFLISFFSAEPDWKLIPTENAKTLPAVAWKLLNLGKMTADKRAEQVENLEACFK